MNLEYGSKLRHPFWSLINLLFWVFAGMLLFTIFGIVICYLIYGNSVISGLMSGSFSIESLKIIQLFSSIGTFIFPAVLLAKQEGRNVLEYLQLKSKIDFRLVILAIVLLYAFTPFIEWTISVNQLMKLPEFLQALENWMRDKEKELELLTKQFLLMESPLDLALSLLIVAIIPGIGEELLFRGCIQKIFSRWTKSHHWGIWIAAIIFSAIHVQFYGFVPRMLLGALFGYLFFWSKNLIIPMIAHFINNGTAVVSAYIIQRNGASIDSITEQPNYPAYVPLLSIAATAGLLVLFYKFSGGKEELDERELG